MFSKATANFLHQTDPEGSLIHVSCINDSHKLVPMALVVKRNRLWSWQRPKYQPTDFTLSDLLQGDLVLQPGVSEMYYLSYKETFGDKLSGKMDTEGVAVHVKLEGEGISKLQSCFGQLKKEELDVKKLLLDSRNRFVDMQHVLVQQLEKRADVLAVVKDRILITNSSSITQKKQYSFKGALRLLNMLVCLKDSNNIEGDSDVSLEIPAGTVIAYSILELDIKKNGHYAICLQPGTIGGFEADSAPLSWPSDDSLSAVDGKCNGQNVQGKEPLNALLTGSQELDLSPLAELPQPTRCTFIDQLQETLKDRCALTYLQCRLEKLCSGETPDMAEKDELSNSQTKSFSAILDQPSSNGHTENGQCGIPAHLKAAHLLVSAIEELPDETVSLLSESSPDFLEALDTLMCRFKESSEPISSRSLPILLQDTQNFQVAEQLLRSANVMLRRDTDLLWAETGNNARVLPLVLYLSINGMALLCSGLK